MQRKEFVRVTPETVGIHSKTIEKLLDTLESGFTEMHSIMIMRHGKVCAEGWWSPYAPGLRHGLQSLSKTYAATAVGIAYTEGILKLDDLIIDIFPEESPKEPSENLKRLTVRDVLCMGCGMDEMPQPTENWICDFLATPVNNIPGTTYMYNSMGSTLLGAIVRKLTGEGLQEYLKPRLFEKIGIDAENLRWALMPDGMEIGGGGLYATTEDNLRLMKLYADGGVWDGQRILAEEYVRRAVSLQNESATEAKGNPQATDNFVGYGFQIWMCRPKGVYRADGAMGQFSIVVPDKDMIISINESATGAHWAQKTLDTVWTFLDEIGNEKTVSENPEAAAHLANRLRHLTLPSPKFAPYDGIMERISGKKFAVSEGRICLENEIMYIMSGAKPSTGLQSFSFDFASGICEMHYVQDALPHQVHISMDGTRYLNEVYTAGSPASKLYLNGYWKVHGTYYSALGEDDQKMLLARALQLFMPGKPQVWYLDLFAQKNDYEAVKRAGVGGHKEINRTNLTADQIAQNLSRAVVRDQIALLKFRNTCPAFGFDAKLTIECLCESRLLMSWENNGYKAVLDADLASREFTVTTSSPQKEHEWIMAHK